MKMNQMIQIIDIKLLIHFYRVMEIIKLIMYVLKEILISFKTSYFVYTDKIYHNILSKYFNFSCY